MTENLAFLYGQLERRAEIQSKRRRIWERYARDLPGWAAALAIGLPSSRTTAGSRTTSSTSSPPRSISARV